MSWNRVMLLGEDVAHRQFLQALCAKLNWRVVDEAFAPRGGGAASGWVIRQFPQRLAELRDGYKGLGLVVAIDGDNVGRSGRIEALRKACDEANTGPRLDRDPVALLVPTWSIDTWLLFFHQRRVVPETVQSKLKAKRLFVRPKGYGAPGVPSDAAPALIRKGPLEALTAGFLATESDPELPSIDSSRRDLARWRT